MFVSGNPTLPGKTPPTLQFFLGFRKKYFENGENSVKTVYLDTIFKNKKINKKKNIPTDPTYFFFRPLPETDIFCY